MEVLADRYELGPVLGSGGMARVVEGHDRLLDRRVAVKLMRDDLSADPAVRDRFLREARSAARFNHPNAVAVYDTGEDGRRPWIVMELVEGPTLADRLAAEGRLDPAEAVDIAAAVLAALDAAHRNGMVHRDVKPANILLPATGGVKLADFGIAKSVQEATAGVTATGQIIGTAKYLSPEQVDGARATPASDVYAVGVVLYEMLAGAPPFTGDSALAVALAHTREPVPPLLGRRPDLDPALATVVETALAKRPEDRYPDAEAMRDALTGAPSAAAVHPAATMVLPSGGATTQVLRRPATPPPRQTPPRAATPWLLIAVAAAALLAALLLAGASDNAPVADPGPTATPADDNDGQGERDKGQQPAEDDDPRPKRDEPEQPAEEPDQATQEPQPTQAPDPTEDPEPSEPAEAPVPTDLPSLIGFLDDAEPEEFGKKQQDLRDKLAKVLGEAGPKQAEEAAKLREEIAKWVADGQLDPDLGPVAATLLEPLATSEPGPPDKDKRPPGKGRGGPPDDDDD